MHRESLGEACWVSLDDHGLEKLSAVTGLITGTRVRHRTELSG